MKKYVSTLLLAFSTVIIGTLFTPAKADLTAATYNITHGYKNDWPKRSSGVCNVIKQVNADIYGLQEVIQDNDQFKTIKQTLKNYGSVGQPRSSGITGLSLWHRFVMNFATDEYCPIFYQQDKLELIDSSTFGINGNGWTSALLPRICTWALLKEITTKKEFFVYNTHLDNKDQEKRVMQIKLITDDIAQRCNDTPVILMGDLNTTFVSDIQKTLSNSGFTHGRQIAKNTEGPVTTHLKGGKPFEIDHILIKPKDAFNVKLYKVFNSMSDKTSDHDPVRMTFTIN
ncbi:MAG TPA: endonuclease/exonuclease/phosphatase family protein [Candidatus Babeliales bacterium]|jgi:endonuclease/exonuclease/phosphatase family metal-dependent hydrolase|nr:endonuclease/exonuclease/phosphatase family protein [Candidatus Babeliales bacterium]